MPVATQNTQKRTKKNTHTQKNTINKIAFPLKLDHALEIFHLLILKNKKKTNKEYKTN